MFGFVPVIQRSDGTYMKDTGPMLRYIARHNNFYPSDPLEAWRCDWLVEKYQPLINVMNAHNFEFGQKSKDGFKNVTEKVLPEFLTLIEPFCKDGWLIGDGSQIYMCDFVIGSIYTDQFANVDNWMPKEIRAEMM